MGEIGVLGKFGYVCGIDHIYTTTGYGLLGLYKT